MESSDAPRGQSPGFKRSRIACSERTRYRRADFEKNFLRPKRPVIYRGYARAWPAVRRWTPQHLAQVAGDRSIPVYEAETGFRASPSIMRLSKYVAGLDRGGFDRARPYLRNCFLAAHLPMLLADVRKVKLARPNLLVHPKLAPALPRFWDNWFELFLSGPKTRFPRVHLDRNHTHAWVIQVNGAKTIWAWPNEAIRSRTLRTDLTVTPNTDLDHFFPGFKPVVGVLAPADLMFIPGGWWHTAESITVSITLSGNWVDSSNRGEFLSSYFDSIDRKEGVDGMFQAGNVSRRRLNSKFTGF